MGKRLIRIFQKDIPSRIPALINHELDLVLKNNTTVHGLLRKFENNHLLLEGRLREKHSIPLQEVIEVVYDKEAAY